MTRIDAHQHFWKVDRGDYGWIVPGSHLDRDFTPADLAPLTAAAGIDATIAVQAAPTDAETDFLLALTEADPTMVGVVGWVDLASDGVADRLAELAQHPKFVGVRPMLQDLNDPAWILDPVVNDRLALLVEHDLTFDLLGFPGHLPYVLAAVADLPQLRVVIDHLAKPRYRGIAPLWATAMQDWAHRDNTAVKLSGMVSEIGSGWREDQLTDHVELIMELFGPDRVMFGSDWPVCTEAASYAEVVALAERFSAKWSPQAQQGFWSATARTFYRV